MDKIKHFAKHEKESKTIIRAMKIYNQVIGIEFVIEQCAKLIMKIGKGHKTERIDQPHESKIRTLEETETYKYLEILEVDTIKHVDIKE